MSVASLKYYLREGLVPAGEATAPNQARYDERHVSRVRLIRALRDVGQLGIEAIREVLRAIDDPARSLHEVLGSSQWALAPDAAPAGDGELGEVAEFLAELGWVVAVDAPDRRTLARALGSLRTLGLEVTTEAFLPYARAVEPVARSEIGGLAELPSREDAVAYAVIGTVVYEVVLTALRRLAHEHHSAYLSP